MLTPLNSLIANPGTLVLLPAIAIVIAAFVSRGAIWVVVIWTAYAMWHVFMFVQVPSHGNFHATAGPVLLRAGAAAMFFAALGMALLRSVWRTITCRKEERPEHDIIPVTMAGVLLGIVMSVHFTQVLGWIFGGSDHIAITHFVALVPIIPAHFFGSALNTRDDLQSKFFKLVLRSFSLTLMICVVVSAAMPTYISWRAHALSRGYPIAMVKSEMDVSAGSWNITRLNPDSLTFFTAPKSRSHFHFQFLSFTPDGCVVFHWSYLLMDFQDSRGQAEATCKAWMKKRSAP